MNLKRKDNFILELSKLPEYSGYSYKEIDSNVNAVLKDSERLKNFSSVLSEKIPNYSEYDWSPEDVSKNVKEIFSVEEKLTPKQIEEDLRHKAVSKILPDAPLNKLEPPAPMLGTPWSVFSQKSPEHQNISNFMRTGAKEAVNLWEQGKPGQSYLHTLGTIGGSVGMAGMAPLSATFPRVSQEVGKAVTTMFEQRKPGEDEKGLPWAPYGVGPSTGVRLGDARSVTTPTLAQLAEKHPTAARIAGDVANIAAIPATIAGLGGLQKGLLKPIGETLIKKGTKNVSKVIEKNVDALYGVADKKIKKDLGVKDDMQTRKKKINDLIIEEGLESYIIDKNAFQSKSLQRAKEYVDKADDELLKSFYGPKSKKDITTQKEKKYGFTLEESKIGAYTINPWRLAEDVIAEEKNKGVRGLFSGKQGKSLEKAYRSLQDEYHKEFNKPKSVEEIIEFKRDVLNKNDDLFKKSSGINEPEPAEITIKKLIYHKINDELAEKSEKYQEYNKRAKNLFNLAKMAEGYTPNKQIISPMRIGQMVGTVTGGFLGSKLGGALGVPGYGHFAGMGVGATLGALGGTALGVTVPSLSKPSSIMRGLGRALAPEETKFLRPAIRPSQEQIALSSVRDRTGVPTKQEINFSKKMGDKKLITLRDKKTGIPLMYAREIAKEQLSKKTKKRSKKGGK